VLAWEGRTTRQVRGDGEAEARYDIRVSCALCGKRLRTGGAGLRPLQLAVRLLRSGGRGGGPARREKLSGADVEACGTYRWLRDNGFPEGFQVLCLSCSDLKGTGQRCTLALQQVRRRSQSNEEDR
jgi:hypothetical protein